MRSFSFSFFHCCCWPFNRKSNPAPLDDDDTIFLGPTMSTSNYVTCDV